MGQCQSSRATTNANSVVMIIVPDTAIPYAAARLDEDLNASTSVSTATRRAPLMPGKKICPIALPDVCWMVMRGA